MRILIATDLTARSDRALARAFALAQEMRSALSVVHIVDEDLPDELKDHTVEWAERRLSAEISELSAAAGVVASIETCVGCAQRDIPKLAQSSMTDIIVVGLPDILSNTTFTKSTAGAILRANSKPLLIVKCKVVAPYKAALVGTDFSSKSRAALRAAVSVAPHSYFSLVHAYHIPFQAFLGSPAFRKQYADELQLEFDSFLATETDSLEPQMRTGRINRVLEEGEPAGVIRRTCDRSGIELVAIGAPRNADLLSFIWESPVVGLVNQPPCDLLVVGPS